MPDQTNLPRKSKLLKDFARSISLIEDQLVSEFGQEDAAALMKEAHQFYAELIPKIPSIGKRNPLLIFLLPAVRYLALYRAMQTRSRTVEQTGELIYAIGTAEFEALPGFVRRAIERVWFSNWFKNRVRQRAASSQERRYPAGFVLTYIEGNGLDFDYGVDYLECAGCKFLKEQNALELAPYVCAVDQVAGEMLGWGLRRTTTLAEGGERCDFRFKKGRETEIKIPASLQRSNIG